MAPAFPCWQACILHALRGTTTRLGDTTQGLAGAQYFNHLKVGIPEAPAQRQGCLTS